MSENPYKIRYCKRCGRKLRSAESIELGYGATCYKKAAETIIKPLFSMKENEKC